MGEQLVGRQFQLGEVACRDAQPAHGGGGVQSVPDDVAHQQGDAGAGQGNDVEPVAAHPGLGGQVVVGDLHGALLGQAAREQAALQGQGEGVLAGVAAGVVDAEGGAGGQFLGQPAVVVAEGGRVLRAVEGGDPEQYAAGEQRDADHGVHVVGQDPPGVLDARQHPGRSGGLEVGLQHGRLALQAAHVGGAGVQPHLVADGIEGAVVADAVDHRAVQVRLRVGGLLAAQHGPGQVDRDVVGQARHGRLGEFPGGAAHVQGGADPGTGLGQQLQAAARGDGVLAHLGLAHQHQAPDRAGGVGGVARAGGRAGRRAVVRAGLRVAPGGGVGEVPGQRLGAFGGGEGQGAEGGGGRLRGGEVVRRRGLAGEDRLDDDALHPGQARDRAAQEGDAAPVGQGHLDGGPLRGADEFGGLGLEDHLVLPVQPAVGELVQPDQLPVVGGLPAAGAEPGVEVGPQQGALTRRALLHEPPLDGLRRPADQDRQGGVLVAARVPEAEDADDVAAELVADRRRGAGVRLGPLGEVLGAVDLAQPPLGEREADAVGARVALGEDEARDALDRGQPAGQGGLPEPALQYGPVPVGEGDVHLAAREPGLELVEDRFGRPDEPAVGVEVVRVREVRLLR